MNRDELLALPPTLDVAAAAEVLNIGRTLAYELIRTNQWPTPVFRMGRLIKIPTEPLLKLLSDGSTYDFSRAEPALRPLRPRVGSGNASSFDDPMGSHS